MTHARRNELEALGVKIASPVFTLEDRIRAYGHNPEPVNGLARQNMRHPAAKRVVPVILKGSVV